MNVMNFFKFIATKKPEYGGEEALSKITKGYVIPVNDNSVVDLENFTVNGLITKNSRVNDYFKGVKFYREYNNNELVRQYTTYDINDRGAMSYLADIFGCDDTNSFIRHMEELSESGGKSTTPVLRQKPRYSNFNNILDFDISYDAIELLQEFCTNYLGDLSDSECETIAEILGTEVGDFEGLADYNLSDFFDSLHELDDDWRTPSDVNVLHDYLLNCFISVSQYQADINNRSFSFECQYPNDECNIEYFQMKGSTIYIHTDPEFGGDEPMYNTESEKFVSDEEEAKEGLRYEYLKEYFEKYPIPR
jgi:hypothetical protein